MHPTAQALLAAHLHFIRIRLQDPQLLAQESSFFFNWLQQQQISQLWTSAPIKALLQQQFLYTPLRQQLLQQIQQHIALALQHPINEHTTIEDILPVETIDLIAQYIASKTEIRQKLIQRLVKNPIYLEIIVNIIQQSLDDYLQQSTLAKTLSKNSLFKMGKSVFERATDNPLNDTLRQQLQKNFQKISNTSEKLLNQHLNDDKLYHIQAKLWHKIKKMPLSQLKKLIIIEDLPQTTAMGGQIWQHLRQTPYMQAQLESAVDEWITQHEAETFAKAFNDININDDLFRSEIYALITPIWQQFLQSDHFIERIKIHLELFYSSSQVEDILNNI